MFLLNWILRAKVDLRCNLHTMAHTQKETPGPSEIRGLCHLKKAMLPLRWRSKSSGTSIESQRSPGEVPPVIVPPLCTLLCCRVSERAMPRCRDVSGSPLLSASPFTNGVRQTRGPKHSWDALLLVLLLEPPPTRRQPQGPTCPTCHKYPKAPR